MHVKLFVVQWLNEVRLLVQYRRYSHRRLLALLAAVLALWVGIKIGEALTHGGYLRGNPAVDHWCAREELPAYLSKADPEEVTVVTAVFSPGPQGQGRLPWLHSTPHLLRRAMRPLGRMANPVIAYIEDEDVADYFRQIRSCLPPGKTRVVRVRRGELWSFGLRPQVERIHGLDPGPADPDLTCAAHAKYEVLGRAVRANPFRTPFFAWLDPGYFSGLDQTRFEVFKLVPPATFNVETVSMTQAFPHDPNIPPKDVVAHGLVWVSGGMVLGAGPVLTNFTARYRDTVLTLLKRDLSAGDEQVLYLMYSTPLRRAGQVRVKAYMCHEGQLGLRGRDTRFLCLGYVCRNTWSKIHWPGFN
ncbi:hypothetical protein ACOMHN_009578 [Nucella lapillus]